MAFSEIDEPVGTKFRWHRVVIAIAAEFSVRYLVAACREFARAVPEITPIICGALNECKSSARGIASHLHG